MENLQLVITNANILTLDQQNRRARSLSVTNGRINGVWNTPEPPVSISPDTKVINLKGKTLIPGFIDTHNHILMYSLNKNKLDCSTPPNKSINDILNSIHRIAKHTPKGEWIEGYGYDDTLLKDKRHPVRSELDQAAPEHPVFIKHVSSHLAVVNSEALEAAGINEDISNPDGGYFGRDHHGRLNGVLFETPVMDDVQNAIPKPTLEEMVSKLGKGSRDYLSKGITTNTEAGVGLTNGEYEFDAHIQAAKQGINPMRTQLMIKEILLREGARFGGYNAEPLNQEIIRLSNGKVRLDSAKLFQDGSIQGMTGALRQPYYNNPDIRGQLMYPQRVLNEKILNLHERGFRIAVHGNGDRAIGSILEGFTYALKQKPRADHRHRIEHVQTAAPHDLDKMQQLGVAGSAFINHVYYWGDRHKSIFLGPGRAPGINPLSGMLNRNILFTLHSDCPITPISPLFSIWAAVNRLTKDGEVLGADERIDVLAALKSMTVYGAKLNFHEQNAGTIEIGKQADFAVLEEDPTRINPLEIKDIPVHATVISGEVVYESMG